MYSDKMRKDFAQKHATPLQVTMDRVGYSYRARIMEYCQEVGGCRMMSKCNTCNKITPTMK